MGVINKTTDNINVLLDKTQDWKERGIEWTDVINKPHWVTSATKPTYTAAEVGALPITTRIPTKVSELENDSNFTKATSFKTINGYNIVGEGNIEISGDGVGGGIADAPADDNIYGRMNRNWVLIPKDDGSNLTKANIEKVLTGNIETHTHDTAYEEGELETDVWDGVTISQSLQGEGTEESPYLIQSCADWLYMRGNVNNFNIYQQNNLEEITSFGPIFKLTRNLDFNNLEIPGISHSDVAVGWLINGENATISNFVGNEVITSAEYSYGISAPSIFCFFNNFNLKNVTLRNEVSIPACGFFSGSFDYIYNIALNVSIKGKTIIKGELAENNFFIIPTSFIGVYLVAKPELLSYIEDYVNGQVSNHIGIDVSIDDQSVKTNGAKLTAINFIYMLSPTVPVSGYDNSYSNVTAMSNMDDAVFEGDTGIVTAVAASISNFFANSDKSKGLYLFNESDNGSFTPLEGVVFKTTEELQSESFVQELNQVLGSNVFKYEQDSAPTLASHNTVVKYDGYVKQSEFDKFKSSIKVQDQDGSRFIDLDIDLMQSVSNLTEETQIETFGKTYEAITNENVISMLGGVNGIRELAKMLGPASKPVIVSIPMVAYIVPMRLIFTNNISAFYKNAGGAFTPQTGEIPDGGKVVIMFNALSASIAARVTLVINDFNLDTMYAELSVEAKLEPISFTNNLIQENNEKN